MTLSLSLSSLIIGAPVATGGTPQPDAVPANTAAPAVSGSPMVGQTLDASAGAWTGSPFPSFTYQWLRGTTAISGATASSYRPVSADVGETLAVDVKGTNRAGSATKRSAATTAVTAQLKISGAPNDATIGDTPTFAPTITGGTPPYSLALSSGTLPPGRTVNRTAKTETGTYTTAGTYNYVLGATDANGATVYLDVSTQVAAPGVAPQYGAVSASKDGSTGQTYTLGPAWTNRQWYRAALAQPYKETIISGATGATYVAQAADEGFRLVCRGKLNGADVASKALQVVLPPPILLEGFDALSGFTATAGAILSVETSGQQQGAGRLRVTGTGTPSPGFEKTSIGTFDPSTFGTIAELFDIEFDPAYTAVNNLRLNFTRAEASYPSSADYPLTPLYQTPQPLFYGKMWSSKHVSEMPTLAALGSGPLGIVQGNQTQNSQGYSRVAFDTLLARAGGRPTVILGFDDNYYSQYDVAFPYLRNRGMKGVIHLVSSYLSQANRLSKGMIDEMYAAGWDVGLNSSDDGAFTGKGTVQAALDDLATVRDLAVSNGWTRGNEFFCYPNGSYQNAPTRPLVSALNTDGTRVATMSSTSGIVVGMTVAGFQVPAGTLVESVDSATQITMTNAVPAASKPANFVDLRNAFSYTKLPLALKNAGYKMGRTTQNRDGFLSRFGIGDRGGILAPGNATSNRTIDELKASIDKTVLRGETIEFYMHSISDAGGVNTTAEVFTAFIDYIAAKRDAGQLDVLTKSELWARDGGSSVPV